MTTTTPPRPGAAREFASGVALLGVGLRTWLTSPRLMLLGALPALVVGAVFATLLVIWALRVDEVAALLTARLDVGPAWLGPVVDGAAQLVLAGAAVVVAVLAFTATTLAVGDPFYERIARRTEERHGGVVGEVEQGFWRGLGRALGDLVRVLAATVPLAIALALAGFLPVVGQVVVPVVAALTGGWFLVVELTGWAFDARGLTLRRRRRMLAVRRARSVGLGTATYLAFLVPLGAVVAMPAAVVAATLLARDALRDDPATAASLGEDAGPPAGQHVIGPRADGPQPSSSSSGPRTK
ncbi:EI24 domain-containing protein [Frigoribacterium salinisoli]